MNHKLIVFLAILFLTDSLYAQDWLWVKQAGANYRKDEVHSIASDKQGYLYIGIRTDAYSGDTLRIGDTLIVNQSANTYLAKFDKCGQLVWAQKSVLGKVLVRSLKVDNQGNLFMAASCQGSLNLGNGVQFPGGTRNVLVKFDSNGTPLWGTSVVGQSSTIGHDVAIDSSGNAYYCGTFRSAIGLPDTTINSVGDSDMFLIKYDSSGNVLWAMQAGGVDSDYATGLALDSEQNLYVIGNTFSSLFTIDSLSSSSSGSTVFLAKFNPEGSILWLNRSKSASGSTGARGIVVDKQDEIYFVGSVFSQIIFGTDTLNVSLPEGYFLAKFSKHGDVRWLKGATTMFSSGSVYLAANPDTADGVYIAKTITDSVDVGPLIVPSNGKEELMLLKYDPNGVPVFSETVGGPDATSGIITSGIEVSSTGKVHVIGGFTDTIEFGEHQIASGTLYNRIDIFLATYGSCQPPEPEFILSDSLICQGDSTLLSATTIPGCHSYYWLQNDSISIQNTGPLLYVQDSSSYRLVVTEYGCSDTSDSRKVKIASALMTPSILPLGTDSLTSSISASQYQWFLNGQPLPDSTQNIFASQSGIYSLQLVNQACTSDTSTDFSFIATSLADYPDQELPFVLYPNPGTGSIFIKSTHPLADARVYIQDLHGKLLYSEAYHEGGIEIQGIPSGVYLVKFETDEQSGWTRLMVY